MCLCVSIEYMLRARVSSVVFLSFVGVVVVVLVVVLVIYVVAASRK